jgi:hypothetical protein
MKPTMSPGWWGSALPLSLICWLLLGIAVVGLTGCSSTVERWKVECLPADNVRMTLHTDSRELAVALAVSCGLPAPEPESEEPGHVA